MRHRDGAPAVCRSIAARDGTIAVRVHRRYSSSIAQFTLRARNRCQRGADISQTADRLSHGEPRWRSPSASRRRLWATASGNPRGTLPEDNAFRAMAGGGRQPHSAATHSFSGRPREPSAPGGARRGDPLILAGPPFGGYCLAGNPRAKFAQTTDPWKRARDRATSTFDERARHLSAILQEPTRRKRTPMGSSK